MLTIQKGKNITNSLGTVALRCRTEEIAEEVANDTVALSVIKAIEDKVEVTEACLDIHSNLSKEARLKKISESNLAEKQLQEIHDTLDLDADATVSELLMKVHKKGLDEMNSLSTVRGEFGRINQELEDNTDMLNSLQKKLRGIMDDAESDEEDEVWNGKKATKYKEKIIKAVVSSKGEVEQAIEALPVDSPAIISALIAIQSSTADVPSTTVEEITSLREKEEALIDDRMKICRLEEQVSDWKAWNISAAKDNESLGVRMEFVQSHYGEIMDKIKDDMAKVESRAFVKRECPSGVEDLKQSLEDELKILKEVIKSHSGKKPEPPDLLEVQIDTSEIDNAISNSANKLTDVLNSPESSKVTTVKKSFLGLWSWEEEIIC
jgi:hypothetical protein